MAKQICLSLDEKLINALDGIKNETGISISSQISLLSKGYFIGLSEGYKPEIAQESKKRQVCLSLDEKVIDYLNKVKDYTGISLSLQIDLKFKGYYIDELHKLKEYYAKKEDDGSFLFRYYHEIIN